MSPAGGQDGKLRVVTLVDRLGTGGAERLAIQTTTRLDPERFDRAAPQAEAGQRFLAAQLERHIGSRMRGQHMVVRIETDGPSQIVYYRAGNRGKGKGKGRVEKMVIRREAERVIFVDTPSTILVDIDLRLRL